MNKIWKLIDSKTNKLIVIKDKSIYKGNINEIDFNRINSETTDFSFVKELFNIPYSYIKKVEKQAGKNVIRIFFGNDSEEVLLIKNETIKNEVFGFIKNDNPNFKFKTELPSVFKYAKAQLFAILFLTGIFIWSLYLAIQIESGVEYELVGGGRPGIVGVILIIANLGVIKITIGFITLAAIAIFALVRRLNSRSVIETLKR